jgi:hypothetical protein
MDSSRVLTTMVASFFVDRSRSRKLSESDAMEAAPLDGSRQRATLHREEAKLNREETILDRRRAISNRRPYFRSRGRTAMNRQSRANNPRRDILNRQLLAED